MREVWAFTLARWAFFSAGVEVEVEGLRDPEYGNNVDWRKEEVKKSDNSGQQSVGMWTKTELEVRARYGVSFSPAPSPLGARLAPEPEELDFPQSSDRVGLTCLTIAIVVAFITPTITPRIAISPCFPFALRCFLRCYCCCSSFSPVVDDVCYRRIKIKVFGGLSVLWVGDDHGTGEEIQHFQFDMHVIRILGVPSRTRLEGSIMMTHLYRQEPLQHPLDALLLIVIFELFLFDEPGYVFHLSL